MPIFIVEILILRFAEPINLPTLQTLALQKLNEFLFAHGIHVRTVIEPVQKIRVSSVLPVSFNGNTDWIRFVGRPYNGEHNEVNQRDVSSEFFTTLPVSSFAST